ncbi:hypothetical protein C8024_11175 [Sphingopyxis sp. BSNA05]|nr:hypothetical protein [Sphingopyxis sp. BSNA05]
MMTAMVCCPFQNRSLTGHLRHDTDGEAHFRAGFESAMGEIAVIADADAHVDEGKAEEKGRPFDPAGGVEDGPV